MKKNELTDARSILEDLVPYPNAQTGDVRRFIAEGVRPFVGAPGADLDEDGNLIVRLGPGPSPNVRPFYVCTYAQDFGPGDQKDPYKSKIVDGTEHGQDGDCLWGRGNCEHRGALAAALAALNRMAGTKPEKSNLKRPLIFMVLTTGESGHHRVIDRAMKNGEMKMGDGVIARGTGNRVCLGNKGSLHAHIEIHGQSYHPSNPKKALNAIDGAEEALRRLKEFVAANPVDDPDLGDSVLVPIEIYSRPPGPIIPDQCVIELSGRLLPGQDPEGLIARMRETLQIPGGFRTEVILDRSHYPAKVEPEAPLAQAAKEAVREAGGDTEPLYMHASLDAGYFCHEGRAGISLGPGAPELAHSPHDMVSINELEDGAQIYFSLFQRMTGE